ncbi:hypothetical protein ACJIZ3_015823 [Penstemon smallii]|uniref:C3H1-type domain-containing protein n=1 Tax=Penstemon smallii TaxID=265156 RepID=A0ABD3RNQ3_9LAMI
MLEQQITINEIEEEESEDHNTYNNNDTDTNKEAPECAAAGRTVRRKEVKKEKRKKKRKELAEMARREEEARLNDPEEQLRLQAEEEREKARAEKERREFEERERKILEEWERRRALEEEEEERRRRAREEEDHLKGTQVGYENEVDEDAWEYVEEGPPEIIWQGNEIIVKKKKVRVKKKDPDQHIIKEDPNRPTSNPLPPQSEAFSDYKNGSIPTAQQLLGNVAQQTPNFGTEQDKAHCPFHLKTGACRFGSSCSRIHFYPDKSCTLLIKNMYNGPGLAWEQDEGLEVCKNGSSHLRGNVYVHYKSLDSAVLSYQSVNGRYFAGKQMQCEFVGVTRWRVAICGEFMKSKLMSCSRGKACNFIHCFRNPGGDYEWADWDKPPPRYWVKKMIALFGCCDDSAYDKQVEQVSPRLFKNSSRILTNDEYRYHSGRSQSRETDHLRSSRYYLEDDIQNSAHRRRRSSDRKRTEVVDEKLCDDTTRVNKHKKYASSVSSDNYSLERDRGRNSLPDSSRKSSKTRTNKKPEPKGGQRNREIDSAYIYAERHLESDGSEESGDEKSKTSSAHKRKQSSSGDYLVRRSREVEHDSGEPSNYGPRHESSGSSSRKDTGELECGKSGKQYSYDDQKSKRNRDTEKKTDSESRIEYHEGKRCRTSDHQFDETDKRGRWEPDSVV